MVRMLYLMFVHWLVDGAAGSCQGISVPPPTTPRD